MSSERPAPLVVLAGPSGAGKTTIVDRLLATTALPIRRAITATSRQPRPGEIEGVHYHFWTPEEFERKIAAGEMLEHAYVHGLHHYGTPLSEVTDARKAGMGVILVIDVQGAEQVRKLCPEGLVTVFLAPPQFDDLAERLRKRGDSEESIRRRLESAVGESARTGEFQHALVNADVGVAARELERIIAAEFSQTGSASCSSN
jgi:guanylate kinase